MRFCDLATIAYESKREGADALIIMPVYTEYPVLFEHLAHLKRQTLQNFDLIVCIGNAADEKKITDFIAQNSFHFGIIIAKRKEDTGAPGGFITGQLYALEHGYKYTINAESDCYPVDKNVVELVYASREKKYVGPRVHQMDDGRPASDVLSTINHYTLISVDLLQKYGLYYMPLYLGGEDAEYMERIKEKRHIVDCYCTHPVTGKNVHRRIERHLLYVLNGVVIEKRPMRFLHQFFKLMLASYSLLFFMRQEYSRNFPKIVSSLLSLRFGLPFLKSMQPYGFETIAPASCPNFIELSFESIRPPLQYFAGLFLQGFGVFRKDVCVKNAYELSPAFLMPIFARRACAPFGGENSLLLSEQKSAPLHFAKLLLFFLSFPLFFLLMFLLFFPIKLFFCPNTLKYGLE